MDERTMIIGAVIAVALCGCGAFAYSQYSSDSSKPDSSEKAKTTLGEASIAGPQQQAAAGVQAAIEQPSPDQQKDKAKKWPELLTEGMKTTFPIVTNMGALWCLSSMAGVSFWPSAIIDAARKDPTQALVYAGVSIAVFNLIQGFMLSKKIAGKRVLAAISIPAGIFGGYLVCCGYSALVTYPRVVAPVFSIASVVAAWMSFAMYSPTPPPLPLLVDDAPGDPKWFLNNNCTTQEGAKMCETGDYKLVKDWSSTATTLVQDTRNSAHGGGKPHGDHHLLFLCPSDIDHQRYSNYDTVSKLLNPDGVAGPVNPECAARDILCALQKLATQSNKSVFARLHSGGTGYVDGVDDKREQRVVIDFNPEGDNRYHEPADGATAITNFTDIDALLLKWKEIAKSHQGVCLHMSQDKKTLHVWGDKTIAAGAPSSGRSSASSSEAAV